MVKGLPIAFGSIKCFIFVKKNDNLIKNMSVDSEKVVRCQF